MEVMWSLIIFTLFVCISAGSFAAQGIFAILGKGLKMQFPTLIVSLIALVIGGIGSFTHLQNWERAFNGFGHITSGITQELIGVVLMVIAMVVYFLVMRKKDNVPKWAGVMAVVVSCLMLILMTTSYMMPARPIWNSFVLYLFYFAQAIVLGGAIAWIISHVVHTQDIQALSARITAFGAVLVVIAAVSYLAVIASAGFAEVGYYYDPTQPTKPMQEVGDIFTSVLTGANAIYFWLALVLGGLIPAIVALVKSKDGALGTSLGSVALVGALAGGVSFRVLLYVLGFSAFLYF
jgi:anaerobic dimethyl sulfoxide reductase subunit C (anchor subunit)